MYIDLAALLKLQDIDYHLGELERSKEYLPDMMENLAREISEAKRKVEETSHVVSDLKVKQKHHEMEVKSAEADLAKYQQMMMSIKTNKEYDALVAQIDAIKAAISSNEAALVETMERLELLEKELVGYREKESQIVETNSKQLQILQEKIDSIGAKVSDKEADRQQVVSSIPKPTLSTYERVRRGKGGRAVVAVKRRACGSCFKALTPKKIQEIKRADRITTCDNCGCMLYWEEGESN